MGIAEKSQVKRPEIYYISEAHEVGIGGAL